MLKVILEIVLREFRVHVVVKFDEMAHRFQIGMRLKRSSEQLFHRHPFLDNELRIGNVRYCRLSVSEGNRLHIIRHVLDVRNGFNQLH